MADADLNGDPPVERPLLIPDRALDDATRFSFESITRTLRDFIVAAPADAPFNVCVSGSWGSGKTTLLRSLARQLIGAEEGQAQDADRRNVGVWFEPWKLADEREVRDVLTLQVLDVIGADASFMTQARIDVDGGSLVRAVGERFLKLKLDDVSRTARVETAVRGTFAEVERLFGAIARSYLSSRRMFVFVDDLDRCRPKVQIAVLEAVKLFFDLPGLVFVFALDRQQLEHAIAAEYGFAVDDARVYLEKTFQLSVPLPRKRPEDLVAFLREKLGEVGLEVADTQLAEAVVSRFGRNLRDLKLFVNALSFQRRLVGDGESEQIGEEAVLKWLYLEATMPASLEVALTDRSLDLVLALELLAYGGFLHDANLRDQYVGRLRRNALNYCALVVYAIIAGRGPSELAAVELTRSQQGIVAALTADGALDATLRVLRAGTTRLLNVDLWRLAALARERPTPAPRERDADKDEDLGLDVEGPLTAGEWNELGERLRRDGATGDAYLCLLMAVLIEPRRPLFLRNLARLMRRLERPDGAKALLTRAHEVYDRSTLADVQMGFLYDLDLGDHDAGTLFYRRALEAGSLDSQVPNNLAANFSRAGRHRDAYYCGLAAYVRRSDPIRRMRLNRYAREAGMPSVHGMDLDALRALLGRATDDGLYPPRLDQDERARVEEIYATQVDAAAAEEALSHPPLPRR